MTKNNVLPHASFKYVRPDEVAECWNGVGEKMYKVLWNLTNYIERIPAEVMEDSGPADHVGHGNLADLWHHLTEEEAIALNAIAIRHEEEEEAFMKKVMEMRA